jgi:DNA-binding NtrC family response regulator
MSMATKMKIKVLVVDDEISILNSFKSILEEKGLAVTLAQDGMEALTKMESEEFDIVITDYYMPVMNGEELLRIVKSRFPRVIVIIISGFCTVEDRLDFLFKGAFNCIKKPFKISEIDSIISTAVKLCNNQIAKLKTIN